MRGEHFKLKLFNHIWPIVIFLAGIAIATVVASVIYKRSIDISDPTYEQMQDPAQEQDDRFIIVGDLTVFDPYKNFIGTCTTPFIITPKGSEGSTGDFYYGVPVRYKDISVSDPRIKVQELDVYYMGYRIITFSYDNIYEEETFLLDVTYNGSAINDYYYGGIEHVADSKSFAELLAESITSSDDPTLTEEERALSKEIDDMAVIVPSLQDLLAQATLYFGDASPTRRPRYSDGGSLFQRDIDTLKYKNAICSDRLSFVCKGIKYRDPSIKIYPYLSCIYDPNRESDELNPKLSKEQTVHIELQIKQRGRGNKWISFDPGWSKSHYVMKAKSVPIGSSLAAEQCGYTPNANVDFSTPYCSSFIEMPVDE